jgi:2-polyprenyl-3-methyl-5-hydroxy-6-metoxy-1,4-benzoquinol methylase
MSTCCVHNRDTVRFFGWFAKRYRKRFARKGLEPSQKHLMKGLTASGFNGATLLDIGCGIGYLHQRLLQAGASSAVGVDLSAKMLEEAHAQAREQGLAERTDYREGDFVELADVMAPADIVILDKVICCYPDAQALVEGSARMARRVDERGGNRQPEPTATAPHLDSTTFLSFRVRTQDPQMAILRYW